MESLTSQHKLTCLTQIRKTGNDAANKRTRPSADAMGGSKDLPKTQNTTVPLPEHPKHTALLLKLQDRNFSLPSESRSQFQATTSQIPLQFAFILILELDPVAVGSYAEPQRTKSDGEAAQSQNFKSGLQAPSLSIP